MSPFHIALDRLRATMIPQRGTKSEAVTVERSDLRQLLEHFDRLDSQARQIIPLISEAKAAFDLCCDQRDKLARAATWTLGRLDNPLLDTSLFADAKGMLREALASVNFVPPAQERPADATQTSPLGKDPPRPEE